MPIPHSQQRVNGCDSIVFTTTALVILRKPVFLSNP